MLSQKLEDLNIYEIFKTGATLYLSSDPKDFSAEAMDRAGLAAVLSAFMAYSSARPSSPQGEDAATIAADAAYFYVASQISQAEGSGKLLILKEQIKDAIASALRARLDSAQSSAQGEEASSILDRLRHLTPGGSEFQTANECFAWLEKRLTRKPWKDDSAWEIRKIRETELREATRNAMRDIGIANQSLVLLQDHALRSYDQYAQGQLRNAFAYLDTARSALDFEARAALERNTKE